MVDAMRLPSRRRIKKNLSRKLIYSPFLRMIIFNVWFRVCVLLILGLGAFLALFLPKMWLVTPEGFLPEIRISWLDRVQAWSLRRTAERLTAAGQHGDAWTAWRAAALNNRADAELIRQMLRGFLSVDPPDRKRLGEAFYWASWSMKLTGTNATDLALASDILDRFEEYAYQIRLLAPKADSLAPPQQAAFAKALFHAGLIPQFLDRWNRLPAEMKADPNLALYHDAYQAGWGPADTIAAGRARLAAARSDPLRRLTAHRLQLLVSAHGQDATAYGDALEQLEQWRADRLPDHVKYWLLLAASGRKEAAVQKAELYPHPPTSAHELLLLARAYVQLGLQDTARRLYQHYLPTLGQSMEVWTAYVRLLQDLKAWEELRSAAVQMRQQSGVGDVLAGYSHFLEGRAELALERFAQAELAFELAAKERIDASELRLEVGKALLQLRYPRFARAALVPAEQDLAKNADYWTTLLRASIELRETDRLLQAAERLYALHPEHADAANSYAAALLINGERPEEAIKLTLQLFHSFPNLVATRINHSFALLFNQRVPEALALLRTLPENALSPNDLNQYLLARFETHLALDQLDEARRYLDRLDLAALYPPQRARVERGRTRLDPAPAPSP